MTDAFEIPSVVRRQVENAFMADAARRFINAEHEICGTPKPDPGTVIACVAAHHDMLLLADIPCGCDEGTCPGVLG